MKILVGTLYSGENEYEECLASIRKQTLTNYDHIIIENLPERDAHRKLFKTLIDQSGKYQLLIKVDADIVLYSEYLFENIIKKFENNDWLEVMNIGVDDFFTGEMIAAGIQVYRNTVRWDFNKNTLFTDIPIMEMGNYLFDKTDLAPAASHCYNPSPTQAFHYGVHRGLKSIQKIHSTTHWSMLQKVWQNFLNTGDRRLGLAVLGAELVYAGKFNRDDQNYTQPAMELVLSAYQEMTSNEIKAEIQKLRFWHWGFLPNSWRRKIIRQLKGRFGGRWDK